MKRLFKIGGAFVACSTLAATLAFAGPGVASATVVQRPPTNARTIPAVCSTHSRSHVLPRTVTSYNAGAAGTVKVATTSSGTIRVVGVRAAKGYRSSVDSSSGSSVDVYFRHGTHTVKFEAEINDAGGLTTLVTTC